MRYENTLAFARALDEADPLRKYRNQFRLPKQDGKDIIYLCGNSLGMQPKTVKSQMEIELDKWADYGVEAHFKTENPWIQYQIQLKEDMGLLVGASAFEIAIMNSLSVNIHLLMVSFYQPTKQRFKIICEKGSFPSDLYVLASQARFRGLKLTDILIELEPRSGEQTLRNDDIIETISLHSQELALIWMGGVNYYTGQVFDMDKITAAGHKAGAVVGYDLAHAAGNVLLKLHEWNVDFACWCTYKYLNSGPGGIGAVFIHERHGNRQDLQRFTGWWGNNISSRFLMQNEFEPAAGADGWALSTAPVLLMAPLKTSLEIFRKAGMHSLIEKRILLTGFLHFIVMEIAEKFIQHFNIKILTPAGNERGAQLSIIVKQQGKEIYAALQNEGVVGDWREPEVIRLAPAPLYNSFEEIFHVGEILLKVLNSKINMDMRKTISI